MTFEEAYKNLNNAQRQAVDTIDGPVMVVAGPGTGKTQLLSMRVGTILQRTDAGPQNILCLTFTESATVAMRQRLVSLMGPEGYKVAIHTFHSFGVEVINQNPAYFYKGANFRPADELSSFEILEPLFKKLTHDNPLASTMNGQFTALRDTQAAIAQLKKAGLAADELLKLIDHNEQFINHAEPLFNQVFNVPRLTKKILPACEQLLLELQKFDSGPVPVSLYKPLSHICLAELALALERCQTSTSTQPLTAWRNRWLERDHKKNFIFKDRSRNKKLRAVADVYFQYLMAMQENELFDFEDMILRVVHALENFDELRFNLQEQFLYILVDEFQDTNGAQLRLLQNLTNNPSSEQQPNIMVVGDDDQAIYTFQGAEIGNILQFKELYPTSTIITLTENYRSTAQILQPARAIITQGEYRLETTLPDINKTLTPHNKASPSSTELHEFISPVQQYAWITDTVQRLIEQGVPANDIAILGRNHRQLLEILPYLHRANIHTHYERRNNILEAEHIQALVLLARTITTLAEQRYDKADALLPKLLSYPFWGIDPRELWQLSLEAYKQRKFWLEVMLEHKGHLSVIAEFLIITAGRAHYEPLETMLDILIGSTEEQVAADDNTEITEPAESPYEAFISPLRAYYFTQQQLESNPSAYLRLLSNLQVLCRKLREYHPEKFLLLQDFVSFIELHEKIALPIIDSSDEQEDTRAVSLMTAHKSKGLEFKVVFVLSAEETIWGTSARNRTSSIRFPYNMPLEPAGTTNDDCLRLFFVAATRAKQQLYLCYYTTDESGKMVFPVSFLHIENFDPQQHRQASNQLIDKQSSPAWQQRHLTLPNLDKRTLLQPKLENYQLSSTHFNNFLDVTAGGPQAFLLQNLLRFPQTPDRSAVLGSVIHTVLQRAHTHLTHTNERRPIEDILHDFELQLQQARLNEQDFIYLFDKGSKMLQIFLAQRYDTFNPQQKTEFSFAKQGVVVAKARLTGTLDLIALNETEKTITVTDYKTGKPPLGWQGVTDYEKIKLHKYRQQLMIYKLLVENSRDFGGRFKVNQGILEFVEPDAHGTIQCLEMTFNQDELQRLSQLIGIVWHHIMELHIPDTSHYPANYRGIQAFENDLLDGVI